MRSQPNTTLKIAVFSGAIPSTTFIEHLIKGISKHHIVMLFGTVEKPISYDTKTIKIYKTPKNHWLNLIYTLCRLLLLIAKHPKALPKLIKEVKPYKSWYERYIWFSKFLPIILYRPDIFHIQWAKSLEQYGFLKKEFGIKTILSLRGAHINYSPITTPHFAQVYRDYFPHIDAFHAVSKAIGIEAQLYGAVASKINVIYSPISKKFTQVFQPYVKSKNIHILSIGRGHWIKGYNYAINAMALLKQQGIDIHYTIIGIDKQEEALMFQIAQLGLTNEITLLPSVSQKELLLHYKKNDLFLLSSLKEGIANVVLEAMAIGLPVISTQCGGITEVIEHKKTGFLVPIREPEAIASAVIELTNTKEVDLQQMTLTAHEHIKYHFNASDKIEAFLELYNTIANTKDSSY